MKRSLKVVLLAVLALLLLGPLPNSLAGAPRPRLRAPSESTPIKALDRAPDTTDGYGTGTILHADALRTGENALVDLDVAFAGAAYSSAAAGEVTNEVHRLVTGQLGANAGYGRGTALELGLGSDPIPLIGQLSQAAAPPSTNLVEKVIGPLGVPGVLTAELLRSQAQARSRENACVLGKDQAYGLGSVLDLEVLGGLVSTVARPPRREVSQSASTTRIVPGSEAGRLGLKSETRQTIAPVTFFHGSPFQFTIEVLGEWALRAKADGLQGSVHYGPLTESPETPIARVLGARGQVLGQLTTQQLLGDDGLEITIPSVAEIVIGEDPRAIGGDAKTSPTVQGTAVAAAVDVVRVKLIGGTVADVRIGHMEAAVNVPSGGVKCPGLNVDQTVDPPTVTPGDEFDYTIVITNPHDCTLSDVRVVETLTATSGVTFELVSMTPGGGTLAGAVATYPDIGPLGPGATKTLTVKVKIPAGSAPGKLSATAVVTGVCPEENVPALDVPPATPTTPSGDIPVRGEDTVDGPTVGVCVVDDLKGLTVAEAKAALEKAGCILGTVTERAPLAPEDDTPTNVGKVVDQGTPPNTTVPLGTPVDITVNGPLCTVPSLSGLTPAQAETELVKAGCKLGDVTVGPPGGTPDDAGKITTQTPPAGDKVPRGTEVDVTIFPPPCVVPNLVGMNQDQAKEALEKAGCSLGKVTPDPENPAEAGKVLDQGKPSGSSVPRGTEVDITVAGPVRPGTDLGTQVLGETETRNPAADADAAPTLARTGGVALAGLALWLLVSGALTNAAGSRRLWSLFRRR